MILKQRLFDDELSYLLQMSLRTQLTESENEAISMRIKGINGERRFDEIVKKHLGSALVLNNLTFTVQKQIFQIDALIIMNSIIFIFEIKNLHYDIQYKDDRFFFMNDQPIDIMNIQRNRTLKLFKQLLKLNHIDLPFNYYSTFVNPDYKVYGYTPLDNIVEYDAIKKIIRDNSNLGICDYDEYVAQKLLSLHINDEKFNFRKRISIEDLTMGVACHCHIAIYQKLSNRKFKCPACNKEVSCNDYLSKAIDDIRLIYPTERLTVNLLKLWTTGLVSDEKIRLYLNQHYTIRKKGPFTYYR